MLTIYPPGQRTHRPANVAKQGECSASFDVPELANKGLSVDYLLEAYPAADFLPVHLGDDYGDEEASEVVSSRGGIAILVAPTPRHTRAHHRLESPRSARGLLRTLARTWVPGRRVGKRYEVGGDKWTVE